MVGNTSRGRSRSFSPSCSCVYTSISYTELSTEFTDSPHNAPVCSCPHPPPKLENRSIIPENKPFVRNRPSRRPDREPPVKRRSVSSPPTSMAEPMYLKRERTLVQHFAGKPFEPQKRQTLYRMKANEKHTGLHFEAKFENVLYLARKRKEEADWVVPTDERKTPYYSVVLMHGRRTVDNVPILPDIPSLSGLSSTSLTRASGARVIQRTREISVEISSDEGTKENSMYRDLGENTSDDFSICTYQNDTLCEIVGRTPPRAHSSPRRNKSTRESSMVSETEVDQSTADKVASLWKNHYDEGEREGSITLTESSFETSLSFTNIRRSGSYSSLASSPIQRSSTLNIRNGSMTSLDDELEMELESLAAFLNRAQIPTPRVPYNLSNISAATAASMPPHFREVRPPRFEDRSIEKSINDLDVTTCPSFTSTTAEAIFEYNGTPLTDQEKRGLFAYLASVTGGGFSAVATAVVDWMKKRATCTSRKNKPVE